MFTQSKYTKIYYQIIDRAKERTLDGYCEYHHIIPKRLGGPDTPENMVYLTAREHFICHMLLTKMPSSPSDRSKMIAALWCMMNGWGTGQRYVPKSSIVYENLRKKAMTERSVSYTGPGNHFYGRKHSIESRQKMSENNAAKRPEVREKMRGPRPGFLPHNHYTGWSDETKAKISESLTGYQHSAETRARMSAAKSNRKWVHRAPEKPLQINSVMVEEYLKNGWKPGRGPKEYW